MRLLWLIANKSHTAWEAAYDKYQRQDRDGADETVSEFLVWLRNEVKTMRNWGEL
jgi:hypothetical protein